MKQDCVKSPNPHKPRISQCLNHQSAHQPGVPLALHPRCSCCHLPYTKKSLSLCFSLTDIQHLGPGGVLFFSFVLLCTIVILIPTLSYSIYNILCIIQKGLATNNQETSILYKISIISQPTSYNEIQSYILAGCTVLLVLLIPIAIKLAHRTITKLSSPGYQYYYMQPLALLFELEKPADYTEEYIKSTINEWYQTQLKMIEREIGEDQVDIVKNVYFYFNMDIFEAVKKRIDQLQVEKYRLEEQNLDSHYPFQSINFGRDSRRSYSSKNSHHTVQSATQKIDQLKQKIKNKELEKTNKFIIVLKRMEQAEFIKTKFNFFCSSHKSYVNPLVFSGDNFAEVSSAPYPCDIRFDFLHMSAPDKVKRRVLSWIGTVVLIIIGISLQYLSYFGLNKFLWPTTPIVSPILMALAVYFIPNIAIGISSIFVSYELHQTKSNEDLSSYLHCFFILLFMRCFGLFFIFLTYGGFGFSNSVQFCQTVSWLMIVWPLLDAIFKLINHNTLYYFLSNKKQIDQQEMHLKQSQINKQFQKPENKIYYTYAEISTLIISSFAFASMSPLCLITSSIYILLSLLLERIVFIHFYSEPNPSTYRIFIIACTALWKSIIALPLGHFYLIYYLGSSSMDVGSIIKIICAGLIVVSLLLLLIPYRIFEPRIITNLSYQHIQSKIINCYSHFNPVYTSEYTNFTIEPQKSLIRYVTKNQILVEELNTMSKSLEQTLRDKLFNQKHPCLEALNNREDDSLYFEFDVKVSMPEKKPMKQKVPPIFKQNRQDLKFKKNARKNRNSTGNLVKLTNLVNSQEEGEIKKQIKTAIKDSIHKIS